MDTFDQTLTSLFGVAAAEATTPTSASAAPEETVSSIPVDEDSQANYGSYFDTHCIAISLSPRLAPAILSPPHFSSTLLFRYSITDDVPPLYSTDPYPTCHFVFSFLLRPPSPVIDSSQQCISTSKRIWANPPAANSHTEICLKNLTLFIVYLFA
ncbi:hypothetical protein B0H11DRAFT_2281794 [Mycena galericulata]|nr:hypothetical protein B0H11DRAFT_2281794 [Mycena galericulata]